MNTNAQRIPLGRAAPASFSREARQEAGRAGDSLLCTLLVVYLASLLMEGVIRYVLVMAGLPNVLYLRDAIPVATLVVLFMRPLLSDDRIDLAIAVPAALLLFHAAYSAMVGVAVFSIAFGMKIFMFIPYGIAMWPLVRSRFVRALTLAAVMFAATVSGVAVNFMVGQMPWEGLEYETAFGAVATTRMWWMGDAPRLPGFARTSFSAAMILGVTGLLALLRFRHALARLAIAVCAIVAITLTTSKGMLIAFPVAALWLLIQERNPRMNGASLVGVVCGATLLLPLVISYLDLAAGMSRDLPSFLVSVWERFTQVWPLALGLLPEGPHALLGAGLGSIGTPQIFGHAPHRFNPGDNFALFMMVVFGLPGLFYYAFPALSLRKVAAAETRTVHLAYVGLLLLGYGYGMVANMVEESFFSMCFGLCCGAAVSAWQRPAVKAPRRGEHR